MRKLVSALVALGLVGLLAGCDSLGGGTPTTTLIGYETPAGFLPIEDIDGPDDPNTSAPAHYRSAAQSHYNNNYNSRSGQE